MDTLYFRSWLWGLRFANGKLSSVIFLDQGYDMLYEIKYYTMYDNHSN